MADHNHNHHHQHPPSPCLLLCPSIGVRSSSFFPHFPLWSPSPPPSPSSSYLHRILFDCCVLSVIVVVHPCVVSSLLLVTSRTLPGPSCVPPPSSPIFHRGRVLFGVVTTSSSKPPLHPTLTNVFLFYCCVCFIVLSSPLPRPVVDIPPTVSTIVIIVVMAVAFVVVVVILFVAIYHPPSP